MDFLAKAKAKLKEVLDDDKKDDKKDQGHGGHDANRGASNSYYQNQQHNQQYSHGPPPPQNHGGPPSEPQLPPGWHKQWDQNSQRWYFVEQASGRTQWDPPAPMSGYGSHPPPPGQYGHDQSRGAYGSGPGYPQGQNYPGQQYPGQQYPGPGGAYPQGAHPQKKGMNPMMAGAAGAAVGVAGGAWIAHEMTEDSHGNQVYAQQPGAAGGGMYGGPGGVPPPPPEADPNISGSDRESIGEAGDDVRDAQQDYNEALASGSSSDIEEAREDLADAHEDYQEEVEEAYDD